MATANQKLFLGLAAVVLGASVLMVLSSGGRKLPKPPEPVQKAADAAAEKPVEQAVPAAAPENIFIGKYAGAKVNNIYTTRKKETVFQALVRYQPENVGWDEVPGLSDILQVYQRQGRELPRTIRRVVQETETQADNLGESQRFISSVIYYLSPSDTRVIAYDMAQSAGGQPQRMVGHMDKTGFSVDIFRGAQKVDHQQITFVRDTYVPIEFEFIHQWFELPQNREAKLKHEPVKFSVFIPEVMAQVLMAVKPINTEVIPVDDATYNCAHYEILTASSQASDGLYARQEMWFDLEFGRLMKRQDFDASLEPGEAPVTQCEPYVRIEQLKQLAALRIKAPALKPRSLDYLLEKDFDYFVHSGDKPMGRVHFKFSKMEPGKSEPPFMPAGAAAGVYYSAAEVSVNAKDALRNETAVTVYDANWNALNYEARGVEQAGLKLEYALTTRVANEMIHVSSHREAVPELKSAALYAAAMAGYEAGVPAARNDGAEWHDPLRRVAAEDEGEAGASNEPPPRLIDQSWTRTYPAGSFLSDYNRVEHLALLAARLPLPPEPEEGKPVIAAYQNAAIYLVRQNRAGVMQFEVRPELKPVLTERQRRRLSDEELKEPQLYVANATAAMMPSRMLLSPDNRILELTMLYGAADVKFTLNDPIMLRRAKRAQEKKLQEGPKLVRPPWY